MLYIFGGLPGTGKTTLARHVVRSRRALHVRLDTIEQALRDAGVRLSGPEGYVVGYRVAGENLRLGCDVVADCVNPLAITRAAWRDVATKAGVACIEIEVICSDEGEHRRRIENREADIAGQPVLSWKDVVSRAYEPWQTGRLVIDTAGKNVAEVCAELDGRLNR